jgi:hypothetical protein
MHALVKFAHCNESEASADILNCVNQASRIFCLFQAIMHMENMSSSIVTPLSSLWNVRDKLLTPIFHAQLVWQRVLVLSDVGVDQVSDSSLFLSLSTMIVSLNPTLLFLLLHNTVHNPCISGPADCPSWLPAATGNTNAQILIDRLAAHRCSLIFQTSTGTANAGNSGSVDIASGSSSSGSGGDVAITVGSGTSIGGGDFSVTAGLSSEAAGGQASIVAGMSETTSGGNLELAAGQGYTSGLCMILQTCYFYLPHIQYTSVSQVPAKAVVRQISLHEYRERTLVIIKHCINTLIQALQEKTRICQC